MAKKVIDFNEERKRKVEQKRRNIERVVLNDIMGCYSVVDKAGTNYPLKLIDISHNGCLVEIPASDNKNHFFEVDKEITLRFYFTESTFLSVIADIKHMAPTQELGQQKALRIGCEFDKTQPSFVAMEKFIEFLYKFAEFSSNDTGDSKVYFL
ncbi:MAG: PilZ domain-containing protein [Bacteriovoracaceae bacterium]|nr:PilZ domain-containing protein [Bacteriovoracaceae bacterium]